MKLRTEIYARIDGMRVYSPHVCAERIADLEHDALAAHALMRARDDHDASFDAATNEVASIKRRADELMRERGMG